MREGLFCDLKHLFSSSPSPLGRGEPKIKFLSPYYALSRPLPKGEGEQENQVPFGHYALSQRERVKQVVLSLVVPDLLSPSEPIQLA
jgi:hypothetical protein